MKEFGIERLSFYTSRYYLDLQKLAAERNIDPNKYSQGLGQELMAVAPPDEDPVTLAATSAKYALQGIDTQKIGLMLVATESGVDQSKALGIWVHHLLNLPQTCRVIELKQACYSGCAALQMGLSYLHQHPDAKVLISATDIARYGLGSPGEPTQGCGAASFVLSNSPKLVAIDPESGIYTSHVMDFWRPNYSDEAIVDGKFSTKVYVQALTECWKAYSQASGRKFEDHARFCYHIPFTRMAEKAHERLCQLNEKPLERRQIDDSLTYSRKLGNSYTASLFIGLSSLLETATENLTGKRLGFFSYGSGCVAEFFSGRVLPGYRDHLQTERHAHLLANRTSLTVAEYEAFYKFQLPQDGSCYQVARHNTGDFRLAGIEQHKRHYSANI